MAPWQPAPYYILYILSGATFCGVGWMAWLRRPARAAGNLAWLFWVCAGWSLAHLLELQQIYPNLVLIWHDLNQIGLMVVAIFWLVFALHYTGRE